MEPDEVRWDPRLVEEVIRLEGRRRPEFLERYRRDAGRIYRLAPEGREPAFARLHARLFRALGHHERLRAALARHGALAGRIASLTVLRARRPGDEGADLATAEATPRPAVLRLAAERFVSPETLDAYLDHELVHLGDLVDPGFGHAPADLGELPPHRRRLVQERYRAAWAVTVDGRLSRRGLRPLASRGERREELERAFAGLEAADRARLFDSFWDEAQPTHGRLMAAAVTAAMGRQLGAPCPLCSFPTHRWAETADPDLVALIRSDAPGWAAGDGLCERCLEGYQVRCGRG